MKEKAISIIKRHWIVIWIVFASLAFVTAGVVYAAYTKTSSAKSVVARIGNPGKLFSSNYLQRGTAMPDVAIYIDEDDTNIIDYVRISNFAQGNPGKPYNRAINYNISMRLKYLNESVYTSFTNENAASLIGDRYIKVSLNGGTEVYFGKNPVTGNYDNISSDYSVSGSLAGGSPTTDALMVEYSADQILLLKTPNPVKPKLYLEITASPNPLSNYLDLDQLSGRLDIQLAGSAQTVEWTGYINETGARTAQDTDSVPTTLDDYNYVIEGVGNGTITLTWNPEYVELNKDFINEITANVQNSYTPGSSGTMSTLVFKVNSNNTSRYDTQFYRTGKSLANYSAWGKIREYIPTPTFAPETT